MYDINTWQNGLHNDKAMLMACNWPCFYLMNREDRFLQSGGGGGELGLKCASWEKILSVAFSWEWLNLNVGLKELKDCYYLWYFCPFCAKILVARLFNHHEECYATLL